jgi:ribosomal 50S subunit-associated protein YjgA (DUF615 family)
MSDKAKELLEARRAYLRAMYEAVSVEDWRAILQQSVAEARAGDKRAIQFIAKYLLPSDLELIVKFPDTEVKEDEDQR